MGRRRGGIAVIAWLRALDGAERIAIVVFALLLFVPSCAPIAIAGVVSPEDIDGGRVQLTPPCKLRAQGKACWSCGLTRGFASMARGRLGDARRYNRRAPALFAACAGVASVSMLGMAVVVLTRPRRRSSPPG